MLRLLATTVLALGLGATSHTARASEQATGIQVLSATGSVTFNKKPVKVGDLLSGSGTLTTGADGSAKVFVRDAKTLSILKANTSVEFTPTAKAPGTFKLIEGLSRWVVGKIQKDKPVVVTTKSAAMGVRGTEFMTSYNPILGETEIVSFEGSIEFRRKDKPQSKNVVKKGQWGGLGGRFGADVSKIVDLPQEALTYFKGQSEVQTLLKDAVSNPEYHGHKVPK